MLLDLTSTQEQKFVPSTVTTVPDEVTYPRKKPTTAIVLGLLSQWWNTLTKVTWGGKGLLGLCFTITVHQQRKLGQLLKHVSPTLFIIKRNQDSYSNRTGTNSQKLMQRSWNLLLTELLLLACSAWIHTEDRNTSPRMALSKIGWALVINH